MELQLIRNATVKMSFAGKMLLLDPYLGEKGSGPSYTGKEHSPVVSLPIALEEVLDGVDAVVVSHVHSDHFDTTAREILPKDLPLLCQPEDEQTMRDLGFTDVHPVAGTLWLDEISVSRTSGRHGSGAVLKDMGVVSGFFFEAPGEPSVYWAGDTVLTDEIRELLRQTARKSGIPDERLLIPRDGESVLLSAFPPESTADFGAHIEAPPEQPPKITEGRRTLRIDLEWSF